MAKPNAYDDAFDDLFSYDENCELVVACGHDNYENGDIIHAYSERDALRCGANRLCGVQNSGVGTGTPHAFQSLPWIEQHAYYQYKFTQVSKDIAERENIDPTDPNFGQVEEIRETLYEIAITGFGPTQHHGLSRREANQKFIDQHDLAATHEARHDAIYVNDVIAPGYSRTVLNAGSNVDDFFNARLRHHNHRVFIDDQGRRVYFTGRQDFNDETIHLCWDGIEASTAENRMNHRTMKHSPIMWQHKLILPVSNIAVSTAAELTSPLIDENENVINQRKHQIPWNDLEQELSPTVRVNIANPSKTVNLRGVTCVHAWLRKTTKALP